MKLVTFCFAFVAITSCAFSQNLAVTKTEAHWSGDTLLTSPYPPMLTEKDSVVMPTAIKRENPDYPDSARVNLINGKVVVKLWVDKTGRPLRAAILESSDVTFNEPSLAAALKWSFTPATVEGTPIDITLKIPFRFQTKTSD